jgi:hypothetical protein
MIMATNFPKLKGRMDEVNKRPEIKRTNGWADKISAVSLNNEGLTKGLYNSRILKYKKV